MKAITLRDIPDAVAKRIEERAQKKGASLNRTVIELLAEQTSGKKTGPFHDLDDLAGTWTQEEADAFDEALREQRRIDVDIWR